MANIQISDLRPAGADLFLDYESYMHDVTEQEMMNTLGGFKLRILWSGFCLEW
ncbi:MULTISPECIES: hypothetical protein [unclassified Moorena]|uniref:hypothetical protein n=1 Tax=unclassified Moorena TaxID=2683338 RepID=UPI0025F2DFBB|nr:MULTISPECIES: hypothetical protein [unclassified Moorena]